MPLASFSFATHGRAWRAGLLGEHDPAIDLLRESFTQGLPYGLYLHNDADFDGLRNRTAYQQLVQPVN